MKCYKCFLPVVLLAASQAFAADIETHLVESEYQNGKQQIRVLVPDGYQQSHAYRVLYVLPVEKGTRQGFGDGIALLKELDAHNQYNLIIVQMGFEREPWFGDHATNPKIRQGSYVKEFVVPYIEQKYTTLGTAEGRLLLGFSKSGWGAFSLIFKHPEFFGYAAAWDAPLLFRKQHYGMKSVFGSAEQLARYRPELLIAQQKAQFQDKCRLVLSGEKLWGRLKPTPNGGSHTVEMHKLLAKEGVKHHYDNTLNFKHNWNKNWLGPTLAALMQLTHEPQQAD